MLEIKNLSKEYGSYDKVIALKDINLSFERGEFVALVGKSGCGKTTLLNIIAGLLSASEGEVLYEGNDILKLSGDNLNEYRRNHIGIILQNFSLLNDRSVYQNVELPLKIRKMDKSARKELVEEYLEKMDMIEKFNAFPKQLSGGQKQRVAIARALVCNPDILIADEPTGSLDDDNALQIITLLRKIADSGKIVIMATHNKELVKYCDRCVVLCDGQVVL